MNILSNFSERLGELMFENNDVKAKELGLAIGIGDETIRLWKNGKRYILLSQLLKLADFFNCSLEYLAGRTDVKLDYAVKPVADFYTSLRKVMAEENVTRYRLIKETPIYDGYFTQWKKGSSPHILTLVTLADYLGVTIDHLVGRE